MEPVLLDPKLALPPHWRAPTVLFPYPLQDLQVVQTHISIVFLAGDLVYKVKKPVKFPFVDYSSLEKRKAYCRMEVELNRRLAPGVYLDVVPMTLRDGVLCMEGPGEAVEYAVKMRRLPDGDRLNARLASGRLPEDFWPRLVRKLAAFYRQAAQGPEISRWAAPDIVRENWEQVLHQVGFFSRDILEPELHQRITRAFQEEWNRQADWILQRQGRAREGHGDLRMEHVYYSPEAAAPADILVIDSVEFDPRYRCGDPLLDLAFLAMDLEAQGYAPQARDLLRTWFEESGDEDGDLFSFYIAYRHLVRGLVRGLQAGERGLRAEMRARAGDKARLHFLMSYSHLAPTGRRSCLALVTGLPGTGKSTLSDRLRIPENFRVLSSDLVRKELAGLSPESRPGVGFQEGIYTPEWSEKTYAEMLRRSQEALCKGERVLVDASFGEQARREPFRRLAHSLGVPFIVFICRASEPAVRERLSRPDRHGSDADLGVYRDLEKRWQEPPPEWDGVPVNADLGPEECLRQARQALYERHLSQENGSEDL